MRLEDLRVGYTYASPLGDSTSWTIVAINGRTLTYKYHDLQGTRPPAMVDWDSSFSTWVIVKRGKVYPKRRAV